MRVTVVLLLIGLVHQASAMETIQLTPSRDTTLFESATGALANGAGSQLFFGRTQEDTLRRALIAFDPAGIPEGAEVIEATLEFNVNRTVVGNVTATIHPVSQSWGEGTSVAGGQQGRGGPPTPDDATWIHRFSPDSNWNAAGGDFGPAITSLSVGSTGNYSVDLTNLVQQWIDDATNNHGIIILAEEETGTTAKRIGSREGSSPTLTITFVEGDVSNPVPLNVAGLWFDPDLPGEGFNVIQDDTSTTIFYFGYTASGERLWLVTEGLADAVLSGTAQSVNVLVGTPGTFATPGAPESLVPWGTLVVTFVDCGTAIFELSGLDGEKTVNAVKLQGVAGNQCVDDAG